MAANIELGGNNAQVNYFEISVDLAAAQVRGLERAKREKKNT